MTGIYNLGFPLNLYMLANTQIYGMTYIHRYKPKLYVFILGLCGAASALDYELIECGSLQCSPHVPVVVASTST
jgi:hypothetical protein